MLLKLIPLFLLIAWTQANCIIPQNNPDGSHFASKPRECHKLTKNIDHAGDWGSDFSLPTDDYCGYQKIRLELLTDTTPQAESVKVDLMQLMYNHDMNDSLDLHNTDHIEQVYYDHPHKYGVLIPMYPSFPQDSIQICLTVTNYMTE